MAFKTITIKGDPIRKEFTATAATISPGSLVERASATTVKKHATSGGNAVAMFALEDDLQGKEIGDAYAASSKVQCGIFRPGDEVLAILANGTRYSVGDFLESNGAGQLKKHTPQTLEDSNPGTNYTKAIVAVVISAADLSSSSGADAAQRQVVEIV